MSEISPEDLRALLLEADTLARELEAAEGQIRSLRGERDRLRGSPVLSPTELAELAGRLLADLDLELPGMELRDGVLQLQVAAEQVGQRKGFVVAGSESRPEADGGIVTISIPFSRNPEQTGRSGK